MMLASQRRLLSTRRVWIAPPPLAQAPADGFRNVTVRQHQQNGAVTHHLLGFVTQRIHRLFEARFGHVEGDIERVGAVVLLGHGGELFKIRVQQDRRFKGQTVRRPSASQKTFISRPMLVASDITWASRSGSIGGLVTCANC